MHRIDCPWCGLRDEIEFAYRGDATVRRPPADAGIDAFYEYVYLRDNPRGWHVEWWHHAAGCRQWIKVVRHTTTHAIHATAKADEDMQVPRS
ncbi:MAG: sarcosine oxidase subunit delta [Alphaproteobacteria bacterium]|nr:sarcosine oxidase subunit delta [Alphaproteobacteria bacterium]